MSIVMLEPTSPLARYLSTVTHRVGRTTDHDLGVLDAVTIARYALTIGSTDPVHRDPEVARARGYADVVAPPNLLAAIFEWGAGTPESELNPDGTAEDEALFGARDLRLRAMGAGEEMELVNDAVAGMHLTVESKLESAEPKPARSGDCVFVTTLHTFRTTTGLVLNRNRRTIVLRNPREEG